MADMQASRPEFGAISSDKIPPTSSFIKMFAKPDLTPTGSTAGAQGYMTEYDKQVAAATQGGPAAQMARAEAAARAGAAGQSDQAVAQAVKAARTSGMMPGQAALAGSAQAANAYGQGLEAGQDRFTQALTTQAQLGQSMAERLQASEALASAEKQAKMQAAAAKRSQDQGLFGSIIGAGAGALALLSDRRMKEDIKPAGSLSDSLAQIRGYKFKYRGGEKPETGVMAQDVEKTDAAPAVVETPQGKALDTQRLSAINTAAIGEQGRRIKDIERMLRGLGEVK